MSSFPEALPQPLRMPVAVLFLPAHPQSAVLLGRVCDRGTVALSFGQEGVNLGPHLLFRVLLQVSFKTISRNALLLTSDKAFCSGVSNTRGIQETDDYETAHHPCLGYETRSVL